MLSADDDDEYDRRGGRRRRRYLSQHLRLNDPEAATRNDHINFITELKAYPDHEQALLRLRQLAAIYKPVMKEFGLQINHLQEYKHNQEFAGRNFNAGENVEMVLRGPSGGFLPFEIVCSVFAHELAHNFHMNHSTRHTNLTKEINAARRQLQAQGYYGDGFWSRGQRLGDDQWTLGDASTSSANLPGNLCGGAWSRRRRRPEGCRRDTKPAAQNRKRTKVKGTPSPHTGAQTAAKIEQTAGKRRAINLPGPGSRVDSQNHIPLASAKSDSYKFDANSTFRKRANTHAARDARAAAAMRRMATLQQQPKMGFESKASDTAAPTDYKSTLVQGQLPQWELFHHVQDYYEDAQSAQTSGEGGGPKHDTLSSHKESGSETEDELVYDSADAYSEVVAWGTVADDADGPSAATSVTHSDVSTIRRRSAEMGRDGRRKMEQFRGSDGGRAALQSRQEWQELLQHVRRQQQKQYRHRTSATTGASDSRRRQPSDAVKIATRSSSSQALGEVSESRDAKADLSSDSSHKRYADDDDDIVFVGVKTRQS